MRQRRSRSKIALFGLPIAMALGIGLAAYREPAPAAEDAEDALSMTASLGSRTLVVKRGEEVLKEFPIAVGKEKYPTPKGNFTVNRVIWNPAWVPPRSRWARGKAPAAPGSKNNPMKLVKIFFHEPDYYIHGTGAVESLGEAASHGCLRMEPNQAAEVALLVMENSGAAKDWDWVKSVLNIGEQRRMTLSTPTPLTVTD